MTTPFRQFLQANREGRDFYIGDIHGCLHLVHKLMDHVGFDRSKDRLISVGDLVDRGPDSLGALSLLLEPWFYCVAANHEALAMQTMEAFMSHSTPVATYMLQLWVKGGGAWAMETLLAASERRLNLDDDYQLTYDLINDMLPVLPHMLSVKQPDGRHVHVLHAELQPGRHYTSAQMLDEDFINNAITTLNSEGETNVLWGRYRFNWLNKVFFDDKNTPDAIKTLRHFEKSIGSTEDLIISGHTILTQPVQIGNFLNIDTGSFLRHQGKDPTKQYGLTMLNMFAQKLWTADDDGVRPAYRFMVNPAKDFAYWHDK